ncbi:2-hydroxyacyl-CoA dehydratase subunit D [Chloroflexota bacterium]
MAERKVDKRKNVNPLESTRLIGEAVDHYYYEELMKAHEQGRMVSWYVGYPVVQILQAMDISYLVTEQYGARHAARHEEAPLLATADAWGISQEVCSYLRCSLACALYKLGKVTPPPNAPITATQMDSPDFVLCTHPICNQEPEWAQVIGEWYNVPVFMVEVPHCWDESRVEHSVDVLTQYFYDMIEFIEKQTKRPFEWDRLKEIVAETKRCSIYRAELLELGKNIPSPVSFWDLAIAIALTYFLVGRPESTRIMKMMRDEAQDRVNRGEGCIKGEEKYRLFTGAMACWPKFGWAADLYADKGAAVICGDYTHLGWYEDPTIIDPEKPIESLARVVAAYELNHGFPWKVDAYSKLAQDFSCDGLVMHGVRSCRPWSGDHLELLDSMTRRLGIPGMFVDGDNANPQFVSTAQVETRLQALLETIDAQRIAGMGRPLKK